MPTLLVETERFLDTYTCYGRVAVLPRADRFAEEWITFLEFVGSRLAEPGVLLPTSDLHTLLVSQNREALGRHFRFLIADAPAQLVAAYQRLTAMEVPLMI